MFRFVLVACVALSACGGSPDLTGTYSGTLNIRGTCSDSSAVSQSASHIWTLAQSGAGVTVTTDGVCGALNATVAGSVATVDGKACASQTDGSGNTETLSVGIGGAVTLADDGKSIAVDLPVTDLVTPAAGSGGSAVSCDLEWTGTLAKP